MFGAPGSLRVNIFGLERVVGLPQFNKVLVGLLVVVCQTPNQTPAGNEKNANAKYEQLDLFLI